jgi:hypothetical protein
MDFPGENLTQETDGEPRPVIDTMAEFLLFMAIRHQALSPVEANKLAMWDLSTIAEFLALRLEKEGLLTAEQCRNVLGQASNPTH